MNRIDVLNLEWTSYPSRDRNIASLICNYLRIQGYHVVEESIFNGFYAINKYKPTLLFITNGVGARINFQLVKYASLKGIKVVTLTSEGNFKDDINSLPEFLWGWNKDHCLYEDVNMQWSERTRKLILSRFPELKKKIKVSGAVGFDYYKIVPTIEKEGFLKKHNKGHYYKVIGVGCWDFSPFNRADHRYESTVKTYKSDVIARFVKDRDLFNHVIQNLVKNNEDILFVLKEHPGNTMGYYESAIDGCEKYDNVLILKQESIVDCIAISDFWISYESTTNIEAWMLGKQTCLINPTGIDFPRANVYRGTPNYKTAEEMQNAINTFYATHLLPYFLELKDERSKVIHDIIEWEDGLNHVRVGNQIISLLQSECYKIKSLKRLLFIPLKLRYAIAIRIKNSYSYKKYYNFDIQELQLNSKSIKEALLLFYKNRGLTLNKLKNINCK